MARLCRRQPLDAADLADLQRPRDDLVAEAIAPRSGGAATGDGEWSGELRFVAAEGAFRSYERLVRWRPLADRHEVTEPLAATATGDPPGPPRWQVEERIEFRLATPLWGWLFSPLTRRALRRPRPAGWQPWWAPPERLDPRQATVLSLLATLTLVSSYLGTLLSQTLTFAAADFGASKSAQGVLLAAARLGIVATLIATAAADRVGRSRLLRITMLAGCLAMGAVAFAPALLWFGLGQTVSRGLTTAADVIIIILAAEEMPTRCRAWATAVLALIGGLGSGMVVWLLPLADADRSAWRVIYLPPLLFVPLVWWAGRRLPESRRFLVAAREREHREASGIPLPPPRFDAADRRRLALLAVAAFLILVFAAPASQFQNEFLRDERGFSALRITIFTLLSGTPAGLGVWFGGRLAEGVGRRRVGAVGLAGGAVLVGLSFLSHGAPLWALSIVGTMLAGLTVPAMRIYGPELFPTRLRARANGITTLVGVTGSVVGVLIAGTVGDRYGLGLPIAALALAPIIVAVLVITVYPETANRTLEELNPRDAPLPPAGGEAIAPSGPDDPPDGPIPDPPAGPRDGPPDGPPDDDAAASAPAGGIDQRRGAP
jgi:MFS family permease